MGFNSKVQLRHVPRYIWYLYLLQQIPGAVIICICWNWRSNDYAHKIVEILWRTDLSLFLVMHQPHLHHRGPIHFWHLTRQLVLLAAFIWRSVRPIGLTLIGIHSILSASERPRWEDRCVGRTGPFGFLLHAFRKRPTVQTGINLFKFLNFLICEFFLY